MNLALDTVYGVSRRTTRWDGGKMHRGLNPTIIIDSGSVDVYVSNSDEKPTNLTQMTHETTDVMESGKVYKIDAMFRWILFKQLSGTTTKIEAEGLIDERN